MAKEKREEPKMTEDYWKRLKEVVDGIFTATKEDRETMTQNLREFRGEIWDKEKLEEYDSEAVLNYFFSTVENIAPMLSDNKPIMTVSPNEPFMERLGWSYTNALKYVWNTSGAQQTMYEVALDALVMNVGIYEVGYDAQKASGGMMELACVDPRDYFVIPGYTDNRKAPLQGVVSHKPLSWIRKNFPDVLHVTPTATLEEDDKLKTFQYGTAMDFELDAYFAKVYRVWIKDENTLVDIIQKGEDGKDLLDEKGTPIKKKVKAYPGGKMVYFTEHESIGTRACMSDHGLPPWVRQVNYIDPHNFLGIGENTQLGGLNKEFNLQMQYVFGHSRRAHNPVVMIDAAYMSDVEAVKKNINVPGYVFVQDSSGAQRPGDGIIYAKVPPLDSSVPNLIAMIPRWIEEQTGDREISKGQATKKERQSASEIAMMLESSQTRIRQRVRNQEEALKQIGYLWVRDMQQRWTIPRTVKWTVDDTAYYDSFSSMKESAAHMLYEPIKDLYEEYVLGNKPENKIAPDVLDQIHDYEAFLKAYEKTGELDPVYFDFDIEIQTNSSLPTDKQSLANLAIRLFTVKAIDAEDLLEKLNWPNRMATLARRKAAMEAAQQMRSQGGPK